jgi:hypothetical protein
LAKSRKLRNQQKRRKNKKNQRRIRRRERPKPRKSKSRSPSSRQFPWKIARLTIKKTFLANQQC